MSRIDDAPRARRYEASFAGSVAILAWPEDAARAEELARAGQPRLLLVGVDAEPPEDWDGLTDWVRLPVDDRDLCARVAALQRLASRAPEPVLDEFDVLWRGDRWSALVPIEARLVEVLLARSAVPSSAGATSAPRRGPAVHRASARSTPDCDGCAPGSRPWASLSTTCAGGGCCSRWGSPPRTACSARELARALEVEELLGELLDLGPPRLRFLHGHEHELREADREELLEAVAQRGASRPRSPRRDRNPGACAAMLGEGLGHLGAGVEHHRAVVLVVDGAPGGGGRGLDRLPTLGHLGRRAEAREPAVGQLADPAQLPGARPPSHTSSGCCTGRVPIDTPS